MKDKKRVFGEFLGRRVQVERNAPEGVENATKLEQVVRRG